MQTASVWGTWTTRHDLEAISASEGAGQVVGEAQLTRNLGQVIPYDGTSVVTVTALDIVGQFVRILVEDDGGDISISYTSQGGNARFFTGFALWHGVVQSSTTADQGTRLGMQRFNCLGLAAVLGQLVLADGLAARVGAVGDGPSNLYELHRLPAFNRTAGKDRRSTIAYINGTDQAYVHELSGSGAVIWTAKDILDLVLIKWGNGGFYPSFSDASALTWSVSDPDNCLVYEVTDLNLDRSTVLDAVNTIISARRGMTWRLAVSGNTATIVVSSITPTAINQLPAAPTPATVAATTAWVDSVTITTDVSACYDLIEIVGDRPWVGLTVCYDPAAAADPAETALDTGWDGENTTDPISGLTVPDPRWMSRFEFRGDWTGCQYGGGAGLRHSLTVAGSGAMTGARTWDALYTAQPQSLELTRELPCGELFDAVVDGYPRQMPVVVMKSGSNYLRVSKGAEIIDRELGVSIENHPPALRVGTGQQDQGFVASILEPSTADGQLLVTIGLREAAPIRMRWVRPGAKPRELPRILSVPMPELQYHAVLAGTVTGVNAAGTALVTTATDLVLRDDTAAGLDYLDLLVAYYSVPAVTATWRDRGIVERGSTLVPGRYITALTLGDGSGSSETVAIGAVLTRRAWVFSPLSEVGTIYSTERVMPDIEAVR